MIIKTTVEQSYQILRHQVEMLIEWGQINESEGLSEKEAYEIVDIADTVAEAFDALDRKLKEGDAFPIEWTKNR